MRWLIVTDDWPPLSGGVATFGEAVAAELARRGEGVRVLCRDRPALAVPRGVRVTGVSAPSFGRRGPWWVALRGVRAVRQADVVLATTWPLARALRRMRPRRLVLVAHGSEVTRPAGRSGSLRRTWAAATDRWAMSGFLAAELARHQVEAAVLPAPVLAAPWPTPAGDGRRWGFVARATELKGGDRFVRWVSAAGVRGVVVGDGPARPGWERLAAELGAEVTFLGECSREEVRRTMAELDLVVLCPRVAPDGSGAEGLGLVALEAAALGVPAVGCDTGGLREALGPGLCVRDPDDAEASAAAIERWWRPDRGRDAWAWCRATHGVARTVDRLLVGPDR